MNNRSAIRLLPVGLLLLLWLGSCRPQNLFQPGGGRSASARVSGFFAGANEGPYRIRKDDKLTISVWNHDDLSVGSLYGIYSSNEVYGKWVMVDRNGEVPVPKLGLIKLEGLTMLQARDVLAQAYKKWIIDPIIDVKVLNREVSVMGELRNPGRFALEKEENTLIELLSRAGDLDFYADRRHVQVIRQVGGQPQTLVLNLSRMDGLARQNIRILPGDVIYVPTRRGKEADKRLGPLIVPIATALTTLIVAIRFFQ